MSNWPEHRARVAALTRSRSDDDPDLIDARRELKVARLEEYVAKTLATAPELTEQQLEHISRLLKPGARAVTEAGGAR